MKPFFKKESTVLFIGDSITDCNRNRDNPLDYGKGYAKKFIAIYQNLYPEQHITFLNRGISGDTSKMLLNRYETDIKKIAPDFIFLFIGVNDTWRGIHNKEFTSPDTFEINYRTIVSNIRRDFPEAKIVMMEPFALEGEVVIDGFREDLIFKIERVRKLAKEYADYYIPLDSILFQHGITRGGVKELSTDGVHPTDLGHSVIADTLLKQLEII